MKRHVKELQKSSTAVANAAIGDGLQFHQLLENLPAGAYTCDANGLITYFNRRAAEIWGREPKLNDSADRFCGSLKLFSTDGMPLPHDQCWMALALENKQSYNGQEIIIERPDKSRVVVLAHANPLYDESGEMTGAVNVVFDLSDRKKFDDAQSFLAAIVQSSDDAIYSIDLAGTILSWNVAAERLYGYRAAEAIGKPISLITPPEKREAERDIFKRLCFYERIEHFDTVRMARDGRKIDVSVTISPIFDGTGHIVGISKIARDISAQLTDVRRLNEMSHRLSTTLELSPILLETLKTAIAIDGADFGLLSLYDSEANRLQIGAQLGFSDECLKRFAELSPRATASGTCYHEKRREVIADMESNSPDGLYQGFAHLAGFRAVHSTPLMTRSGNIVGVLSTYFRKPHRPSNREMHLIDLCARQAVDFIENARLYEQLREADRLKDEFLATLAHELRNPLAPISNSLQLLRLTDGLPSTAERLRAIMESQVNQLVRIVDDLLEVSRITRGKIEIRNEPVALKTVVENAVDTSRPLIDAAGHQLVISFPSNPMVVEADAVRLSQVIANLLNNGAKYSDPGGKIWLTARRDQNEAVISVRDMGAGISPEILPHIFKLFAQGDRTRHRAQGGIGIGLTLAKNLMELQGGKIEAKSAGTEKGSEFIVRIPLAAENSSTNGSQRIAPAQPDVLPKHRILVVDDTHAAAFVLGKLLEALGQQVQTAASAEEALDQARQERPDLIISDIAMPTIDGYELARLVRNDPELKNVALVALTGFCQESDRQRSKAAGFDYHLIKPVGLEALQELLQTLPAMRSHREVAKKPALKI